MQIKTSMRYLLVPRMVIFKSARRCGGKGTLRYCWREWKLVQALWNSVCRCFQKLRAKPPYDPAIPLLGIYPKKTKTLTQKDTCIPLFTAALVTIVKIWKQRKVHQQMNSSRSWGRYTQWNTIWPKKRDHANCDNTDGLSGHYTKWNKSEKDKYCVICLICGI